MTAIMLRGELPVQQFIVHIYSILIGQLHSSKYKFEKKLKKTLKNTVLVLTRLFFFHCFFHTLVELRNNLKKNLFFKFFSKKYFYLHGNTRCSFVCANALVSFEEQNI